MLTGEVFPVMELLSSMKSHSVPEEIDVSPFISCIMNGSNSTILAFPKLPLEQLFITWP